MHMSGLAISSNEHTFCHQPSNQALEVLLFYLQLHYLFVKLREFLIFNILWILVNMMGFFFLLFSSNILFLLYFCMYIYSLF